MQLVVSTPLKNIIQFGWFFQIGVNMFQIIETTTQVYDIFIYVLNVLIPTISKAKIL